MNDFSWIFPALLLLLVASVALGPRIEAARSRELRRRRLHKTLARWQAVERECERDASSERRARILARADLDSRLVTELLDRSNLEREAAA